MPRSFARKLTVITPPSYLDFLSQSPGEKAIWGLQETTGDVAKAINDAYPAGSVLASSVYPGADVIVNGGFATDTDWAKGDPAITIAAGKATWSGAQAGDADLSATVDPLSNGTRYKILYTLSGVTAGTITPLFGTQAGTSQNANGTFTEEVTANGTAFVLRGDSAFTGSCEIVEVRAANPLNGDIVGATIGQPTGLPAAPYAFKFDGLNDHIRIGSDAFNAFFNRSAGTISIPLRVANAGVWTDGSFDRSIFISADASNALTMDKISTNNSFRMVITFGGVTETVTVTTSTTDWFLATMTWDKDANEFKTYFNGVQQGVTQAIGGTFVGDLDTTKCNIGSETNAAANPWNGWIWPVSLWRRALSADEILQQARLLGVAP